MAMEEVLEKVMHKVLTKVSKRMAAELVGLNLKNSRTQSLKTSHLILLMKENVKEKVLKMVVTKFS